MSTMQEALSSALAGTKIGRRATHAFKSFSEEQKAYADWYERNMKEGGILRFNTFAQANKAFAKRIGTYDFHR